MIMVSLSISVTDHENTPVLCAYVGVVSMVRVRVLIANHTYMSELCMYVVLTVMARSRVRVTHHHTFTVDVFLNAVVVNDSKCVLRGFLFDIRTKKVVGVLIVDPNLGSFLQNPVPGFFEGI